MYLNLIYYLPHLRYKNSYFKGEYIIYDRHNILIIIKIYDLDFDWLYTNKKIK